MRYRETFRTVPIQTLIGIVLGFFIQPLFLKLVMWSVLGKKGKEE